MTMYAPVTGCGPGCLPRLGPRVSGPVRVARVAGVAATVAAGIPLALAMPMLTARARARAVRGWFRILLRAAGVRLVANGPGHAAGAAWTEERRERSDWSDEGRRRGKGRGARASEASAENQEASATKQGALVAANHISWLDIAAVLALEPMRVVAKSEVRRWPVVGLLAARAGTLFIERGRLRRLPATVAEIAAALRAGQHVLVFPEGTTWCGRTRGRLYPATFQAAIDAEAAVRPLVLRYRLADGTPTTVAAFLGPDTLPASLWRVAATRGLVVEVDPAPAMPAGGATRRGLAAATAAAWAAQAAGQAAVAWAGEGSTQFHAPGRTVQVRRRTGPEMSPSAFT
jgi:1-acyl-sn-glycerol-3-phosphate acyltransferase